MSIRFVDTLDEQPKAPNLVEVGTRIIFATIGSLVKPCEVVSPDGEHVSIGIPAAA